MTILATKYFFLLQHGKIFDFIGTTFINLDEPINSWVNRDTNNVKNSHIYFKFTLRNHWKTKLETY